jgi:hypothetical protein
MVRSQPHEPPASTGARRLTLVLLVAAVGVAGVPLRARAALVSDGGGNVVGNGRHNRVSVTVNSPEFNRGIQHVTNTNVGGGNNTQAAFCQKWFRHCRISQRQGFGW